MLLLLLLVASSCVNNVTFAMTSDVVESVLGNMTLEEKVGQMLQLDILKFLNPGTLGKLMMIINDIITVAECLPIL